MKATTRPTARGYRIRDFCAEEGIDRATLWRWAQKGVVTVSRLAPQTGLRVSYAAGKNVASRRIR
jgi:predicted site-specific integrase-resolvase